MCVLWAVSQDYEILVSSYIRRVRGQVSKMALGSEMLQRWVVQNTLTSTVLIP